MLKSLLTPRSNADFAAAVEAVKKSYLTGMYTAPGQVIPLPFRRSFHELFTKEEDWEKPYSPERPVENERVYHHIGNVVAGMAHVIIYTEKHIDSFLPKNETDVDRVFTAQRRLDDLHLAYYHDVGKCIIPRRHAIEGKALFMEPKASVHHRFERIFKAYESDGIYLRDETIPYYAELIGAHDIFGTISTGENGLLSLSGIVSRLTALFSGNVRAVKTAIFDLWLLNIADILVSINRIGNKECNKSEPLDWCLKRPKPLNRDIDWFFASIKGKYLKEDLKYALDIADAALDNERDVYAYAKTLSEKRAVHRFGRLARQTLGDVLEDPKTEFPSAVKAAIIERLESDCVNGDIHRILSGEFGENYPRLFGTMLQFDYALGFFQTIAKTAVKWINEELCGEKYHTGWIYHRKKDKDNGETYPKEFKVRYNAECIVNNYLTVLVGIFGEISRLTSDIENWNIEFEDAKDRLNKAKAERLMFLDGVFRANSARSLLMREIMLYKA